MAFTWTDDEIEAKETLVRKVHMDELRANVDEVDTNLDAHTVSTNYDAHPVVTAEHNGLMTPELREIVVAKHADLLDTYHAEDLIALMERQLPIGSIVMWPHETIPEGWALCDGTNGTIDLRGKFPLATDGAHPLGTTGGEETVTLAVNQMPAHRHTDPYSENAGSATGMSNGFDRVEGSWGSCGSNDTDYDQYINYGGYEGGTGYTDTVFRRKLPTTACIGHNNIPPYRALHFIQKITGLMPVYAGQTGPNADMLDGYHYTDVVNNIMAMIPPQIDYDGGHLHAAKGYQKLSNGLIIQWGKMTSQTENFCIPFTTACFTVQTMHCGSTSNDNSYNKLTALTKTYFSAVTWNAYYLAIGI